MSKVSENKAVTSGINIQFPISRLILEGKKSIETRTYQIPKKYLGQLLALIETPGSSGKFKSRVVGTIRFTECFEYTSEKEFYADFSKHKVSKDSPWAWKTKSKWGWVISEVNVFTKPVALGRAPGIVFSTNLKIRPSR